MKTKNQIKIIIGLAFTGFVIATYLLMFQAEDLGAILSIVVLGSFFYCIIKLIENIHELFTYTEE